MAINLTRNNLPWYKNTTNSSGKEFTMLSLAKYIDSNNQIVEIFSPLIQKLDANYVAYSRLSANGELHCAATDLHFVEHLFKYRIRLATVSVGSGIHMWRENEDKFLFVHDANNFFNHDHGIAIIKRNNDYIETLSIAADANKMQFSDTLIRELEFIGNFYNLVLSEKENIFENIKIDSILVPKEMLKAPENKTCSLKLTPREKQVLLLSADGNTAQQMAKTLNLSRRTIETYLQNLREKYNCKNKAELMKLFFSQTLRSEII